MEWLIFAILSVIFASLREVTQKKALDGEHTTEYLSIRGFYIAIFALLAVPFANFNLSLKTYAICAVVALIATIGNILRNKALKHIDISIVDPLRNLQPLFVTIIAFIFLGEKLTFIQSSGIVLIVIGTYILQLHSKHDRLLDPVRRMKESPYALLVVAAMFIYGVTNTIDRYVLTNLTDFITYFIIVWILKTIFVYIYNAYQHDYHHLKPVFKKYGKQIFWPALFTVLMIIMFYKAISMEYAGIVAAIFSTHSLVATVHGGLLFHEDHIVKKTFACIVMLAGAVMVII